MTIKASLRHDIDDIEERDFSRLPDGISIGYWHMRRVENPEKTISATLVAD